MNRTKLKSLDRLAGDSKVLDLHQDSDQLCEKFVSELRAGHYHCSESSGLSASGEKKAVEALKELIATAKREMIAEVQDILNSNST
jgi:hypothetical protein